MPEAIGSSYWKGTWKEGSGTISTKTDTITEKYFSFSSRFEGLPGASPEELLSTALAGCFNQALANNLGMIGSEADSIETSVIINVKNEPGDFPTITDILITTIAKVSGLTEERLGYCAERARTHCSIARLMRIDPRMDARLST
jgi:osmotically inducible protein OsmC